MFAVFCNTVNQKLNMPFGKEVTGIPKPGFRSKATKANSLVLLILLIGVILWGQVPRE